MVQISIRHGERLLSRRVRDVHWSIDIDARPRHRTIAQNGNLRLRRQVLRTFRNYAKEDFALGTASNKSLAMSKRRWSCLAAQRHGRSHDLPAYSINQARQPTNVGRIEPHPQRTSSLEFLEDLTPIFTRGKLDELNPRILASTGFKLHRFSPPVQLSEFVYVFLRL
jgi:hypothetical protein